jgi:hypothetical protein
MNEGGPSAGKKKVLIVCAHLHGDRSIKRDRSLLQPSSGLQIASLIDPELYAIKLHHEMWHGTLDTAAPPDADIVFLNGLAKDFDRQRQISYFYRRRGAVVVAGGYFCTMFPEFASQYFDVTCAGGVDSVREVMADFEAGTLKPIYRSPQTRISDYRIRYEVLAENGISIPSHLVEASRGCNFRCDFCVIPAEGARHTKYGADRVMETIDDAIKSSPRFSFRRLLPSVWFIDNNFSNDLKYLRELCARLRDDGRIRWWGALVTQDVLRNRAVMSEMARSGCGSVFTGLESFDVEFLQSHGKVQNLSRSSTVVDDIAFAQSLGIVVLYGYLFDPRITSVDAMRGQLDRILATPTLLFPSFISIVSPLVGTKLFWNSVEAGELRPNLRLRDIDGQSIIYSNCRDPDDKLTAFGWDIFRNPHKLVNRRRHLLDYLKRAWQLRRASLVTHIIHGQAHFRLFRLAKGRLGARTKTYIAGTEVLDLQYELTPPDISEADRRHYFEPLVVTDEAGRPAEWLRPYAPKQPVRSRADRAPAPVEA